MLKVPKAARPELQLEPFVRREIMFEVPETAERVNIGTLRGIRAFLATEVIPFFSHYLPESGDRVDYKLSTVRRDL